MYILLFLPFVTIFSFYLYKTLLFDVFYGKHTNQNVYKLIETIHNGIYFFVLVPLSVSRSDVSLKRFLIDFKNKRLTWLRFIYFSLIVIWVNKIITTIYLDIIFSPNFYLLHISVYFVFIGCFFSIAMYAAMNRDVFFFPRDRYQYSTLSKQEMEKQFQIIKQSMEEEKVYLDPDLSLFRLAEITGIPARTISQIINEKTGMRFNDFLNTYRIEYSCQLLKEKEEKTILRILLESGFNSKSTFNSAFKKHKRMTPFEYKLKVAS